MMMSLIKDLLKLPYGSAQKGERSHELAQGEPQQPMESQYSVFGCYQHLMVGRKVEMPTQNGKLLGIVRSEAFLDPTNSLRPTVTVQWPHGIQDVEVKQLVVLPEFVDDESLVPQKVLQLQRNNWALPPQCWGSTHAHNETAALQRTGGVAGMGQQAAGPSRQQLQLPPAPAFRPMTATEQPNLQQHLRQANQPQQGSAAAVYGSPAQDVKASGGPRPSYPARRDLLSPIRQGLSQPGSGQPAAAGPSAGLQQPRPGSGQQVVGQEDGHAEEHGEPMADGTPGGEALRMAAGVLQMLKSQTQVPDKTSKQAGNGKGAAQGSKKRQAEALSDDDEEERPSRLQKISAGALPSSKAKHGRAPQAAADKAAARTRGTAAQPPRTVGRPSKAAQAAAGKAAPKSAPARTKATKHEDEDDEDKEKPITIILTSSGDEEETSIASSEEEESSEEFVEEDDEEEEDEDNKERVEKRRKRRSLPKLQSASRRKQAERARGAGAGPSKRPSRGTVKVDAADGVRTTRSGASPGAALRAPARQDRVQEEEEAVEEEERQGHGSGDEGAEFMTADEELALDQEESEPNYEDDDQWVKGWTGRYYPLALAAKPGDRPVRSAEESVDDGQEYSYEAFVDFWTDDKGNDWVLLKWKGWALDVGECDEHGKLDPRNKGHWELVAGALTGPQRKHFQKWKKGETMPPWLKRQVQVTD